MAALAAEFHALTDRADATPRTPEGERELARLTDRASDVLLRLASTPVRNIGDLAIKMAALDRDCEGGRAIVAAEVWRALARDVASLATGPQAPALAA
jgi:hypothetical protein